MQDLSRRGFLKLSGATAAYAGLAGPTAMAESPVGRDLKWLDALGTKGLIDKGEITPLEAVNAAIDRAEAINPKINAFVTTRFEAAREAAARAGSGSLSGVPTAIKDLTNLAGSPTSYGSRAFLGYEPEDQSPYVDAWLDAGTIPLGKSTTPEMGLISSTEPLSSGATRNPFDLNRIPGGSSGGAAALVAAGVIPIAHASDGGGSIRIPASCCGLFGLKPSVGQLKSTGGTPPPLPISVNHAVTRSVRDSVALFAATQDQSEDAAFDPVPQGLSPLTRRLKIGYAPEPLSSAGRLDAGVRSAIDETARLCEALGHTVEPYSFDLDGDAFNDAFILYWAAGAAEFVRDASAFAGKPPSPDILEPWTLALADHFMKNQTAFGPALNTLMSAKARHDALLGDFDVILTPTLGQVAPAIGEQSPNVDFDTLMTRVTAFVGYTPLQNVAGAPAMSVPLSMSESGLPIGSHFSAKVGEDRLLFELALELEAAAPWHDRYPDLS